MTAHPAEQEAVVLAGKLGFPAVHAMLLRSTGDVETWRCSDGVQRVVLKRYLAAHAGLSPSERCRKSQLAAAEFSAVGLPTPAVLGAEARAQEASLLFEDIPVRTWGDESRQCAAAVLRLLHELHRDALSSELSDLLLATEPNRERVQIGLRESVATLDASIPEWRHEQPRLAVEIDELLRRTEPAPPASDVRIIHGDYFSANLLPAGDTVQIVDWDLAAFGDPAWDLAFLIGAEPGVDAAARDAALAAYGPLPSETVGRLRWHLRTWDAFWTVRRMTDEVRATVG